MDTSSQKLTEAVHYICRRMATRPELLGAVKLQKILWYVDVRSFGVTGKTLTGALFVKGKYGPYTLAATAAIHQLVREGRLHADAEEYYDNEKARLIGKGETNKVVFSTRELSWLEEITKDVCECHTAQSISDRSHGPIWQIAAYGEEIPFEATAVSLVRPSQEAVELARKDLSLAG
jgi:hypothetical protein